MTINHATYTPRPDSVSGQVLALLQTERDTPPSNRWVWSPSSIAAELGLPLGGVRQALKALADSGLVRKVPARYEVTEEETQ